MKFLYGAVAVVVLAGLAILIAMNTQTPASLSNDDAGRVTTPPIDINIKDATRTDTDVQKETVLKNNSGDFILFGKTMGWGPCPPGQKCEMSAQVWKSGKFLYNYEFVKTLSKAEMDAIAKIIKDNNLMTLKCEPEQIDDLTFSYRISDGVTENYFDTPLCKDLFKPIEKILGI